MNSSSLHGIKGENFEVRLEYTDEYVIAHFPVIHRFTKETFQEMKIFLEDWTQFFQTMGYQGTSAALAKDNEKMVRLVSGLGFKHVGTTEDMYVFLYTGEL